jgi:hypothetical protein
VTLQIILVFPLMLTRSKTFIWDHVSVFDKYLHWPYVSMSVKIIIYIYCNRISVRVKIFGHVSVNHLHLYWIYTPYIWLLTHACTTLVRTQFGTFHDPLITKLHNLQVCK